MHLLGASSLLFRGSPAAVADAFRRQGLACVQLVPGFPGQPFREPGQFSATTCRQVARAFEDAGIRIACLAASANLMDPDLDRRHRGVMRLHALIRHARDFGTHYVVTETGSLAPRSARDPSPSRITPEAWDELRLILRTALDLAGEQGVVLLLKPDPSHLLATTEDGLRLRAELQSPALAFVMDPVHYLEDSPPARWAAELERVFEQLGPWAPLAHLKDLQSGPDGVSKPPAGRGALDFAFLFRLLNRYQAGAPIILEHIRPDELLATMAFLQPFLA